MCLRAIGGVFISILAFKAKLVKDTEYINAGAEYAEYYLIDDGMYNDFYILRPVCIRAYRILFPIIVALAIAACIRKDIGDRHSHLKALPFLAILPFIWVTAFDSDPFYSAVRRSELWKLSYEFGANGYIYAVGNTILSQQVYFSSSV